jgi:ATP-dependent Lon protease
MKFLFEETSQLDKKVKEATLPPELKFRVERMVERLNRMAKFGGYSAEYESVSRYIDWVVSLPWGRSSGEILDLKKAREVLDKNHYGMEKVKERILEYLTVRKLTATRMDANAPTTVGAANGRESKVVHGPGAESRAEVLCFVGLPGIGKTSVSYSIAEALGRPYVRIAMGGMGSVEQLRGQSRVFPDAEPGLVIKNLRRAQVNNPVLLLDEIDRVTEQGWSGIMGVLLELLDPEQNSAFTDHYIDYPFNLSEVLFLCSANNTRNISNAVLDRLEIIEMPAYTDEEKLHIGRDYLLPRSLAECGLKSGQLVIQEDLWPKIIRPLGYDAGIRTLDRTLHGICRKVARKIVEGEGKRFVLTSENIKDFLPSW